MSDHLSVPGVSRIFQGARGQSTQALLPVDFEVRENDFVTILGPSGCGKSTLLRIVAGLDYPTTGQVMLDGRPVEGPGGDRGVVFQSYTLFPWLTIAQNIRFGVNSGLMIAQVTAAALASENKSLAHPASVDSLPTSANQEDHVSMATFGARRLAEMADNTAVVVGIEAMGAAQGIELKRGLRSSPLLEATFADLRSRVAFLHQDRFLAPDVEAMRRWAGRAIWPDALLRLLPSHADACAAAHAATA